MLDALEQTGRRKFGSVSDARGPAEGIVDFEQRLRECERLVYRVALGVLADRADAEEVAQEVFLRAYRKLSSLRDGDKFRSWVARMSWRLAINRQRAMSRARRRDSLWLESTPPLQGNIETLAAEREFHSRLRAEIDRLPEKLRGVLLLSAVEDLQTREIAAVLEIPEGTVRSRLHLARKELLRVFCHERM
ncbi:MAG: sigma-70 family RNA polymerase sigma factor [Acidobacteriia bacterium]|nr:sigma-70 family RNA polymerase sigma factor [Terriglobia bacterium]